MVVSRLIAVPRLVDVQVDQTTLKCGSESVSYRNEIVVGQAKGLILMKLGQTCAT